jgi:hypothetical protein
MPQVVVLNVFEISGNFAHLLGQGAQLVVTDQVLFERSRLVRQKRLPLRARFQRSRQ